MRGRRVLLLAALALFATAWIPGQSVVQGRPYYYGPYRPYYRPYYPYRVYGGPVFVGPRVYVGVGVAPAPVIVAPPPVVVTPAPVVAAPVYAAPAAPAAPAPAAPLSPLPAPTPNP